MNKSFQTKKYTSSQGPEAPADRLSSYLQESEFYQFKTWIPFLSGLLEKNFKKYCFLVKLSLQLVMRETRFGSQSETKHGICFN